MTLTPIFTFQNRQVRVAGTPDNPIFCAVDVCEILGIENSRDAIASLDADEKITVANSDGNPRAGIPHQLAFVTESGLYTLIFKSRKQEAKTFRKWVTAEVLPAIRRTGGYQTPSPAGGGSALDHAEALVKAMREQETRLARVEALAIQANSYNSSNTGFFTVRAYANILGIRLCLSDAKSIGKQASEFCRSHGIRTGRARDELFGEVNSYPAEVLEEIFKPAAGHNG
ncbi:MAG: BRO family protein [Verrucomicrobiota bacterium]